MKKKTNWFKKFLTISFIIFMGLYISSISGFYEAKLSNKVALTDEAIKEFEKDGELALCGGQIAEFADNPKVITGYRNVPTEHNEILNFVKKRNPFNHMTVMLKKQAVQSVGGYQHMPYFEDYWLWVRMFKAGYKAKNVDQVLVKVRAGQEMIARRGGLNYAMCIIRFEKALNGIGVINIAEMIGYVTLRSIVSIMPESLRLWIYGCKLRK